MPEQIFEFLLNINSPELQARLLWIKLPFLFVTAFFLAIIAISFTRTPYLNLSMLADAVEVATYRPLGFSSARRRWQKIMKHLETDSEAEYKLAIIEADSLLDEILQKMDVSGANIDERLQTVTPLMLTNIEELRGAHEIRNSVVYDVDYRLSLAEARRVLEVYQRAFENLDLFR